MAPGPRGDDRFEPRPTPRERVALVVAVAAVVALVVARAWVSDDAAITARSADNLLHGHGLRWNVSERVQSFTHPLWAAALVAAMASGLGWYASLLALGVVATALTLHGLLRAAPANIALRLAALAGLASSISFLDFSTSGLENPLTNLLLVALVAATPVAAPTARDLRRMAAVVGLLALSRMDAVLLALPALAYATARAARSGDVRWRAALGSIATGVSPLLAWEAFSVIYFGFPFPNTAYAKLNTGIDRLTTFRLGLDTYRFALAMDPWVLVGALAFAAFCLRHRAGGASVALLAGAPVYYAYILWIGGDFMGGRFFVAPLVLCAAVATSRHTIAGARGGAPLLAAVCAGGAVCLLVRLVAAGGAPDFGGVVDERRQYAPYTGLLAVVRSGRGGPDHAWLRLGAQWKQEAAQGAGVTVRHGYAVGLSGVAAGPGVHIVDHLALADPLLARLPAGFDPRYRPGHFERMGQWSSPVPVTKRCPLEHEVCQFWRRYEESLIAGTCKLDDPRLCAYWDELRRVTEGALFSKERWRAIVALNTGRLEPWIDRARYRNAVLAYPGVTR